MNQKKILRNLLKIELGAFAHQLKLVESKPRLLKKSEIIEAIAVLRRVSRYTEEFHEQYSVIITALIWTYSPPKYRDGLRQILTPILSSLNFSPSNSIIDNDFKENGIYSPNISFIDKIKTISNDLSNSIQIRNETFILTGFQSRLWKRIDESKLIGISAPTSAGKSFLLYLKIIDLILNCGFTKFVYIVPTLSLIGQVTADLSNLFKNFGVKKIEVLNSFENLEKNFIFIVTQERALTVFSEKGIDDFDLLIVDEVQNIERVANEGPDRSKILYDVLKDVKNDLNVKKIILSGPRLKNIANLGFEIFGELSDEQSTEASPVANLTYSVSQEKSAYYINQYSSVLPKPLKLKIDNGKEIYGLGKTQYNDKFNNYLNSIVNNLQDNVNIIFSPTAPQARKSAKSFFEFSKRRKGKLNDDYLGKLTEYIKSSVHQFYELAQFLEKGIAYHTGKTPMHVRKCLEIAAKEGLVKNIFCTTTLMQGVNLPANNLVIRNPNLFTRRGKQNIQLTAYEFANLRGRTGRLLIDLIGRTIVLDESAFLIVEDLEEKSFFDEEYKEIKIGYGDLYIEHKDLIDDFLIQDERLEDAPSKHLLTYIRYTLFKYGSEGIERIRDVGIDVDRKLLKKTLKDLRQIELPIDLASKNRYWDPMDLAHLFNICKRQQVKIPSNVWERNLSNKLLSCLNIMKNEFTYYFKRYIDVENEKYLFSLSITAEKWAREESLFNILTKRFGSDYNEKIANDIENEIDKINSKICFGIPMLLKPISDIYHDDNSFISSLEYGAYSPATKYFIDRGVPRDTAIRMSKVLRYGDREIIQSKINWNLLEKKLNYWEIKQHSHLIP